MQTYTFSSESTSNALIILIGLRLTFHEFRIERHQHYPWWIICTCRNPGWYPIAYISISCCGTNSRFGSVMRGSLVRFSGINTHPHQTPHWRTSITKYSLLLFECVYSSPRRLYVAPWFPLIASGGARKSLSVGIINKVNFCGFEIPTKWWMQLVGYLQIRPARRGSFILLHICHVFCFGHFPRYGADSRVTNDYQWPIYAEKKEKLLAVQSELHDINSISATIWSPKIPAELIHISLTSW